MQLEYWSRVAHVLLLFHDPDRAGYDARAETYIRYGPPTRAVQGPPEIAGFVKEPDVPGRLAGVQSPREFLALLEEKGA